LKKNPKAGRTTLPALFKTKADLGKAIEVFDEWASAAVPAPPPLSDQKPLFLA
jgi:hypothetical protein